MFKSIIKQIRSLLFLIIDLFLLQIKSNTKYEKKNVLIIRLDAIGDAIVWLDSAKEYKQIYPDHTLFLLYNELWKDIAENLTYFDNYIPLNRIQFVKNPFYYYKIISRLRYLGINVLIQTRYSRDAIDDHIAFLSGAKEKIGIRQTLLKKNKIYTRLIDISSENEIDLIKNGEFIKKMGIKDFHAQLPVIPDQLIKLWNNGIDQYYLMFPGAGSNQRRWPLEKFVELSKYIYNKTGLVGIISGSPNEYELGEEMKNSCPAGYLSNSIGKTDIREMIGLIQKSKFIVTNETSSVHIAIALKIDSICILGGGHYGRFLPYPEELNPKQNIACYKMNCYYCNWECVYEIKGDQPYPCISSVSFELVKKEVDKVLSKNKLFSKE